ncbi:type VI secretion system protein TssL, long form [Pseudooceanicola sp. C21-150M6]|uniref:type VI secretion system protein TssL, long form n=1 Tax=Pseudooceanicola sp. C21-150M6 TaxID=3434355 RepID=UPI003D7FCD73
MADEDPFAEPGDTDRTVIRPNPGGRRGASVAPGPAPATGAAASGSGFGVPSQPQAAPPPTDREALADGMTGTNALTAAAATLFALISRIRNRAQHADPDALRRSVVEEVGEFEKRAVQSGTDPQNIRIARYAICATIDDVVLNTPWGGTSVWGQQSMVATFHRETVGGDRFYDLLARLEQDPGRNIDLLEFLYMCLSLGFEGRLRVEDRGAERHLEIRAGLARIIRAQRGDTEAELAPHWRGVNSPHRRLSVWKPLWIALAVALLLCGGLFGGLTWALNGPTEQLIGQFDALDPAGPVELERRAPPPIVRPPDDSELKRVSSFLEEEIAQGLVTVFQDATTITVRMAGAGMFGSGSSDLKSEFDTALARVSDALNETQGPVIIVGHSDNQPIRSARFPSNMHLSLARAESVMTQVAEKLDDPARLKAEGRADKEPIASNDTREGRAVNRRIEIVLVKQEQG